MRILEDESGIFGGGGEVKKEEAEGDGNEASEGVMCRCARGRRR